MRPHLPLVLRAALLLGAVAALTSPSAADSVSVGSIMETGDSITHGIKSATWRWYLFKDFVDNGVSNTAVGAVKKPNTPSVWANTGSVYGNSVFTNLCSAIASGRLDEYAGVSNAKIPVWTVNAVNNGYISAEYANTYIENWIADENGNPLSATNRTGGTFTGDAFHVDTFVMMLGINDMLPSNQSVDTCVSNMKTIVSAVQEGNADAKIYLMSVTPWTEYSSWSSNAGANYKPMDVQHKSNVVAYNNALQEYAEENDNITYINANKGLIDVTKATTLSNGDVVNFTAVSNNMLNASDGVHGISQGDRLLAANVAEGMNIAGRTAGQKRLGAASFTYASVEAEGGSATQAWTASDNLTEGFSVDIQGLKLGTAYEGAGVKTDYNTDDTLSITVGNGTFSGTLSINDAYITWGDYYLYSTDMAINTDDLRIAYVNGNAAEGLLGGYYVWLGDRLIGEGLGANNTSRAGVTNGLTISYGGETSRLTVGNIALTAGAYAPLTELDWDSDNAYLATAVSKAESQGVQDFSQATQKATTTNNRVSLVSAASTGATGTTDLTVNNVMSVVDSVKVSGNYAMQVELGQGAQVAAAAYAATVTGNVTLQIDGEGTVFGMDKSYETAYSNGGVQLSFAGGIASTVSGKISSIINAGTFLTNVVGGSGAGAGNIGSAELYINGGYIQGNVVGGNLAGTGSIGGTKVTITGGSIGGDVYGGSLSGTRNTGASSAVIITGGTIGGDVYGNDSSGGGSVSLDTLADVRGTVHTAELSITGTGVAKLAGLDYTGSNISVADTATLEIENAIAISSPVTVSGKLTVDDHAEISVGSAAVGSFIATSGSSFSDTEHELSRNGYCGQSLTLMTADTLTVNGTLTGTGILSGGEITVDGNSIRSTITAYCINDTETTFIYSASDTKSGVYSAGDIILGSGGTLELAEGLRDGVSVTSNSGTVNIASGVTLDADSVTGAVNLKGSGTYTFDGNGGTLATGKAPTLAELTGATASSEWTGTVSLSNLRGNGIDFSNLANSNSKVELNGVSGWLGPWNGSTGNKIAYNIRLTNDGDTAAYTWGGAYSSYASDVTGPYFSGAITGNGTFSASVTSGKYCNFTFEGNLSGWNGTFLLTGGSSKLHLQGSATQVNAAITKSSGATLDLVIGNGNDAFSTTLNGSVNVSSVSLQAESTLTVPQADWSSTSLKMANDSSLVLNATGGTKTLKFSGLNNTGTTTITTGTAWNTNATISSLTGSGTLNLVSKATVYVSSLYKLGGTATTDHFSGTINLTLNASNNAARGVALSLQDGSVAQDAVICFYKQSANTKAGSNLALALAATGETKVAGLTDSASNNSGSTAALLVLSTASMSASADIRNSTYTAATTDGTTRTLTITGSGDYSTSAALGTHLNLKKTGTGTQTFSGNMSSFDGSITMDKGTLRFLNTSSLLVNQLTLAAGTELSAFNSTDITTTTLKEGSLGATGLYVSGEGATLNANLVLNSSAVQLDATLQMGSSLTLSGVSLSGTLLDGLSENKSVVLFSGADSLIIGSGEAITGDYKFTDADMSTAFSNLDTDLYTVSYTASTGDLTLTMTPEPATATLSLLALAGLAARRRRLR